jgi:hypothetical protein
MIMVQGSRKKSVSKFKTMKPVIFFITLCGLICFLAAGPAPADFATGMAAYKEGDYAVALGEFKKQKTPKAFYMLGTMYLKGEGVANDPVEATLWFRKAAEQGLAEARYALGLCYLNGDGVLRNRNEALRLFRLAANQGNEDAIRMLGRLLTEPHSAGQDMMMLRESLQMKSGPDDERSLGEIAGFDVTVKYGTIRLKSKFWDWGAEFTTLLPNLYPGGPGNRRGLDLF